MDALIIVFDDWEQVLAETLPPDLRKPYREAIVKFRYWLRQTGKTPDAETFKICWGMRTYPQRKSTCTRPSIPASACITRLRRYERFLPDVRFTRAGAPCRTHP